MSSLERDLAGRIYRILHQPHDEQNVHELVKQIYRYAYAYISSKAKSGRLSQFIQLSYEQMAWDCIADMFRRDENGAYPEFQRFFSGKSLYESEGTEVESMLRCFVFNHVNDRLFELLREHDRELSKLTRNLKSAARSSDRVYLTNYESSSWVVLNKHQPRASDHYLLPPEMLEARLTGKVKPGSSAPEILEGCIDVLEKSDCSPSYPAVGLAVAVRALLDRCTESEESVSHSYLEKDARDVADRVINQVKNTLFDQYVGEKVSESLYLSYFDCIREVLHERYEFGNTRADSLFQKLQKHVEGLDRTLYTQYHRNILEYLNRKVAKQLEFFLKKEGFLFSKKEYM